MFSGLTEVPRVAVRVFRPHSPRLVPERRPFGIVEGCSVRFDLGMGPGARSSLGGGNTCCVVSRPWPSASFYSRQVATRRMMPPLRRPRALRPPLLRQVAALTTAIVSTTTSTRGTEAGAGPIILRHRRWRPPPGSTPSGQWAVQADWDPSKHHEARDPHRRAHSGVDRLERSVVRSVDIENQRASGAVEEN